MSSGPCPAYILLIVYPGVAFLRWSSRKTRIRSTKPRNLWGYSTAPVLFFPTPFRLHTGKSRTGARACAQDKARSPRRQGARARTKAPPPGARGDLGGGPRATPQPSRAGPSGAERLRARPSLAERPGVGWCSCVPAAQQFAAPASSPPPPPQRAWAGRPATRREGGPERGESGTAAGAAAAAARWAPAAARQPRVPPRLSVPVSVCLSACQPPESARAPSRHAWAPALPAVSANPSRLLPRVFLSAASAPMLGGSAPSPRSPALRPSVITPAPSSRLGRPGGVGCRSSWGSA